MDRRGIALGSAAAVLILAWWHKATIKRALQVVWSGDPDAADRKHASEAFEIAASNVATLRKRLFDLEQAMQDIPNSSDSSSGLMGKGAKGHYYFSSDGKKLPNKWDAFDVDENGDSAAQTLSQQKQANTPVASHTPVASQHSRSSLIKRLGVTEKQIEDCMCDLDTLRCPDPDVKARRKQIVDALQSLLDQIDGMRRQLA